MDNDEELIRAQARVRELECRWWFAKIVALYGLGLLCLPDDHSFGIWVVPMLAATIMLARA